ncbi:MAG TPA: FimV/HubP family polar landmark protein [Telluria sp.]|nr:FimV/HubP family polar landmark protein [Telluria sp.]
MSTALKTVTAAVASAVLVTSAAQAAGLGRLTVLSALGQPLRAEIELTAVGEDEASGLQAKLASPDAFRVANIEFNPALLTLRFAVEQRNGRQFIKISSTQPLNEPFVDMLLELSWNGGKLVREYTFLLDPAELRTTQSAQVAAEPRAAAQPRAAERAPEQAATPAARPQRQSRPAEEKPPVEKKRTDTEYRVKAGDTLGRIAGQLKPEGISLDIMLVALYRANPDAFIGNNMNRLKSGQILAVPDADTIRATGDGEARNIVVAHAADFNAYRNKLAGQVAAGAPAAAPQASQSAAGKITAKVQERPTAANEAQDQLKLSKAAPAQGTGGKGTTSAPEDVIAKEKALAEAQARVKELERNVSDLEKLMTVKSQAGSAAVKNAAPEAAKTTPAKPAAKPAETKPAQEKKPEAPKKAAPPPPPPPAPEPGPLDFVFENIKVVGGALAIALLAALGIAQRRRKTIKDAETPAAEPSLLGVPTEATHSLFAETGGQSVDTNNSVFNSSFAPSASQLDTNEVDPVAEADVYIAYGRDAQAEEILKEALRMHPDRYPVRLKLLEIYAARKDQRSFETQAAELYSQTRGQGEEWAQAAALGLSIDPLNPLYAGGAGAAPAAPPPSDEEVGQQALLAQQLDAFAPAAEPRAATDDDFNLETAAAAEPTALPEIAPVPAEEPVVAKAEEDHSLDFDLGGLSFEPVNATEPIPMAAPTEAPVAEDATAVPDLDFHVDLPDPMAAEPVAQAEPVIEPVPEFEPQFAALADEPAAEEAQPEPKAEEAFDLAFDMDFDTAAPTPAPAVEAVDEAQDKHDGPLALDLSLDGPASDIDMADLAKDFDLPDLPKVEPEQSAPADELKDPLFDLDVMDFSLPQGSPAAGPQPAVAEEPEALDDPFALPELAATPAPAPAMPAFDLSDIDLDLPEPARAELPLPEVEIEMEGVGAGAGDLSPAHMEMETKLDLALAYQEIGDKEGARELLDEVIKGGNSEQVSKATAMRDKLA